MEQHPPLTLKDKSECFATGACVATAGADLGLKHAGCGVCRGELRGGAAHAGHAGAPRPGDPWSEAVPAMAWAAWPPRDEP